MVSRFWGGASAEAFAKRAPNPNVCLPNRNVAAALRFAERADASLRVLEAEEEEQAAGRAGGPGGSRP